MLGDFTKLLSSKSQLPTDVTFNLHSGTFSAHKAVLAHSLPVFDALFYGEEADPLLYKVDVEIVSPSSFRVFLHHVYGATVELDTLSFHTLVELHWLAVKYQDESFITQLVSKIEEMVERETNYETLTLWEDLVTKYTGMVGSPHIGGEIESRGGSRDCLGIELMEEKRSRRRKRLKDVWRIITKLDNKGRGFC